MNIWKFLKFKFFYDMLFGKTHRGPDCGTTDCDLPGMTGCGNNGLPKKPYCGTVTHCDPLMSDQYSPSSNSRGYGFRPWVDSDYPDHYPDDYSDDYTDDFPDEYMVDQDYCDWDDDPAYNRMDDDVDGYDRNFYD